jgi:hypothetical protein
MLRLRLLTGVSGCEIWVMEIAQHLARADVRDGAHLAGGVRHLGLSFRELAYLALVVPDGVFAVGAPPCSQRIMDITGISESLAP